MTDNYPCAPRRRFSDSRQAQAASISIAQRQKKLRLPVPCSKCKGWHLS